MVAVDKHNQGNTWNFAWALGYTYQWWPLHAPAEMSASKWSHSAQFQKLWRKCGWVAANLNLPKLPRNWNQKKTKATWAGLAKPSTTDLDLLVTYQPGPSPLRDVDRPQTYQFSPWLQMWPWLSGLGINAHSGSGKAGRGPRCYHLQRAHGQTAWLLQAQVISLNSRGALLE